MPSTNYKNNRKWSRSSIKGFYNKVFNEKLVNSVLKDYDSDILFESRDGRLFKKGVIMKGDAFQAMVKDDGSPMTVQEKFEQLSKYTGLYQLPIVAQSVILEEIFANGLEDDLAAKYNKYFKPKNEVVRQF